jgi:hypothetical protein
MSEETISSLSTLYSPWNPSWLSSLALTFPTASRRGIRPCLPLCTRFAHHRVPRWPRSINVLHSNLHYKLRPSKIPGLPRLLLILLPLSSLNIVPLLTYLQQHLDISRYPHICHVKHVKRQAIMIDSNIYWYRFST